VGKVNPTLHQGIGDFSERAGLVVNIVLALSALGDISHHDILTQKKKKKKKVSF
jgi:hypothetical protein